MFLERSPIAQIHFVKKLCAKKSFCSAFKINAGAVRLLGCSKLEDGIITLKWQIFPHMVDVFQEELSDA